MRVYLDIDIDLLILACNKCSSLIKSIITKESHLYTDSGIFVINNKELNRVRIEDGKISTLELSCGTAILDSSKVSYSKNEYQIPVPYREIDIIKTEYYYASNNVAKTKLIIERSNDICIDYYFNTSQSFSLINDDITTLLSELKFC